MCIAKPVRRTPAGKSEPRIARIVGSGPVKTTTREPVDEFDAAVGQSGGGARTTLSTL